MLARAPESGMCKSLLLGKSVRNGVGIVGVLASFPNAPWSLFWAWALSFLSVLYSSGQWVRVCEEDIVITCQLLLELNKEVHSFCDSISFPLFAKRVTTEVSLPSPTGYGSSFPHDFNSGVRKEVRSMRGLASLITISQALCNSKTFDKILGCDK